MHPDIDKKLTTWERAQGLAADVEAYGRWMRDEAELRIGHLYPDAIGSNGEGLTPIAWIWARTVESPDPSWSGHVPLVASWTLSKRPGKPKVWIEPIIDRDAQTISYEVREGGEPTLGRSVHRGQGTCIATGAAITPAYIKAEGAAGRMESQLMVVAVEGPSGRAYLSPTDRHFRAANCELPQELPVGAITHNPRYMLPPLYGLDEWWKLFTQRQLVALTTFSELLPRVAEHVREDATRAGIADNQIRLRDGGSEATAYADAVVTYLAFAIDKLADLGNSLVGWEPVAQCPRHMFGRQAIPMVWDFAEANPFSNSSGSFMTCLKGTVNGLTSIGLLLGTNARAIQMDASAHVSLERNAVVSTDPPYYDNVPYADISDFFYVWMRKNLGEVWPDELSTISTPKAQELVADNIRSGSKEEAEKFFELGMAEFMKVLSSNANLPVPTTVYYAYKAMEAKGGGVQSTGWDTFLQAVIDAGLQVSATWPMRTETAGRLRAHGSNALATSVVLACRPLSASARLATRGEFIGALREELPDAVRILQSGNVAPVDMAQSTIGPGIKVFSQFAKVVEADGTQMPVSSALAIINDVLGEVLDGEEAELDRDTRFALTWFSEHGFSPGSSGDADNVANAKNTSLAGVEESGIGEARAGKFRLYERSELPSGYSPVDDLRRTVWESVQHLIAALERSESEAAELLHILGGYGERARQLAYLLYQKANDKGWAAEAGAYNGLITAWPNLRSGADATAASAASPSQQALL